MFLDELFLEGEGCYIFIEAGVLWMKFTFNKVKENYGVYKYRLTK